MPALLSIDAGPCVDEAMIAAVTREKAIMFTPHLLTTILSKIHDGRRIHCRFSDCAVAIDRAATTVPSIERCRQQDRCRRNCKTRARKTAWQGPSLRKHAAL